MIETAIIYIAISSTLRGISGRQNLYHANGDRYLKEALLEPLSAD